MAETDKEYKYRRLISNILEYYEQTTNDFDKLCDCELENGEHQELCVSSLMRFQVKEFERIKINIRFP